MDPAGYIDDGIVQLPADNVIKPPYASSELLCIDSANKNIAAPYPLFPEQTESKIAPAMPSIVPVIRSRLSDLP